MVEAMRAHCATYPGAAESWQWDCHVFKVGGKIFAIVSPDSSSVSLKATKENQAVLIQDPAIEPAPYLHTGGWVMVTVSDDDTRALAEELTAESYRLVLAGLPKRVREAL